MKREQDNTHSNVNDKARRGIRICTNQPTRVLSQAYSKVRDLAHDTTRQEHCFCSCARPRRHVEHGFAIVPPPFFQQGTVEWTWQSMREHALGRCAMSALRHHIVLRAPDIDAMSSGDQCVRRHRFLPFR